VAACVGNAAEWYDFAIYGSLATVIGLVFFPAQDLASALSQRWPAYAPWRFGGFFAMAVRSTGFALTAGLATAVIGGTAPFVAQLRGHPR
jgi:hypothetical protein